MRGMESSYQALKSRWLAGEKGRELSLQLMFFAWMHWADPPFVTHMTDDPEAERFWFEAFDHMGGEASTDVEFLFVAGLMAKLFPYVLGDEAEWTERGSRMMQHAMALFPAALPLSTFDNRGKYGEYFAHQLRGHLDAR